METLNEIVKFNPTKATLQAVVLKSEGLTISSIDDVAGFEAVKIARKELQDYRLEITRFGKSKRDFYTQANREIMRQEKELLEIIVPTEEKLKLEMDIVIAEKERVARLVLLPIRRERLEKIGTEIQDDNFLLGMDENEFDAFFNIRNAEYLAMRERQLNEERERLEKEKQEVEDAKIREAELEKARIEGAEKAKREAEEKAEKEKQDAIDKIRQEQAEKEQCDRDLVAQQEQAEKERVEALRLEQEKAEKNKKYKAWLKKNGYTNDEEFKVERDFATNTFTLYKKIDSITI